jgi:predicted negative regulator of RcsB-dependent stress response
LDVYTTEEEQVEALKKWWKENGTSIIFGIVIGLAAVFGWRGWQEHKSAQAQAASELFQDVLTALRTDSPDKAESPAQEIVKTYGSTGYAVPSQLVLAKLAVKDNKLDEAAAHLEQALAQSDSPSLSMVIRLRLARVQSAKGDYDAALATLKVKDPGAFGPAYDELKGDILANQGHAQDAYAAYQQALEKYRKQGSDTSVLEMKIDELGVAKQG